ncbi:MAG: MMPL family transporter [Nitrospirae bacterium]|nr:MMPL family transporter [Nitrospirota bacterium]
MEHILKKVVNIVFSYHKLIVIVFSLLTLISLIIVFKMEIKSDIIDVLPKGNRSVSQFSDFIEKYGLMDKVVVSVESKNGKIDENTDLIETLTKNLSTSPFIEYVDHTPFGFKNDFFIQHFPLFLDEKGIRQLRERLTTEGIKRQVRLNYQRLISPFSSPLDYELVRKDPLNVSGIIMDSIKRSERDDVFDFSSGYYFTKDHSAAFIFVKPKGRSRDMAFVKDFKREMDAIISSSLREHNNPADIKIGTTGGHIISEEVRQTIQHDILSSFALSVLLIGLLIWLVYRVRVAALLIIAFTLLASLSMTLAFASFLFGSLNIVTSIVAAVLIGLYVDYSMHTLKRYGDELMDGKDIRKAMEITLTKTGSAFVISAVTTSLSFFSIIATRFEGLYELGIVAGIGVILCLISSLLLMNSLLLWVIRSRSKNILYKGNISSGVEGLINLVVSKPRHILFVSGLFIIFAGFGISKLGFDNNPEHIGIKDSRSIKITKEINQKGEPLIILINGKDKKSLFNSFDLLEKTLSELKGNGLIKSYDSLNFFLPSLSAQRLTNDRLAEFRISLRPDNIKDAFESATVKYGMSYQEDYVSDYLGKVLSAVTSEGVVSLEEVETIQDPRINHFYNKKDLSIAAYIYPTGKDWDAHTLKEIKNYIRSDQNWILLGRPFLFDEIKSSIIRGSILATILTLTFNFIVIYWFFKKIFYVVLTMLPVIAGFLLTLGILGYANLNFNFINIGAIALIFGFGVDYGIYVMQAFIREKEGDVGSALRITGKNVLMCAGTTVAGCGSLVTAKFSGIATIGSVLSIGAVSCTLTSLVMLPAILYLNRERI